MRLRNTNTNLDIVHFAYSNHNIYTIKVADISLILKRLCITTFIEIPHQFPFELQSKCNNFKLCWV